MSKRNRIGADNPNFQDGKTISHSYVVLSSKIWGKDQGRYEHRVVMERVLDRPLKPNEIVHHKNRNTLDNRPENLEVMSRQDHNRTHGTGQFMSCAKCGKEKWYSGAMILKLRNQGTNYLCRSCAVAHTYEKTCGRCGEIFPGGMTALYCSKCTRKNRRR